ncbi:aspartate/glutamate racemase family protein [Elioraea thermophila]|uniref:aspartate/glutamate racemase family protein n=1 Tax=Elioraea thermophila TaxID=2185104 RepID=UPI000DF26B13|nr:aspartate/glutamate racemase family protein [Elioraea thermophila]
MRLLLINGNTDAALTARMVGLAMAEVGQGVEVNGATARFGARYIASRVAAAIAAHAVLDAYAEAAAQGGEPDAVLIACFGDPGLHALRELAPVPVTGMAEASILVAAAVGQRIALLTGGAAWVPMLEEFAAAMGFSGRVIVRAVAATGDRIARDPEAALASLVEEARAAVERDRAEVVVLGGAGLAGLAPRLAPLIPVPVLDSLASGVRFALALASLGLAPRAAQPVEDPSAFAGLGAALSAVLAGARQIRTARS